MQKVRIFTNSASDLTPELADEFGITLIPDTVIFGSEELLNNIDIDAPRFYDKLRMSPELPKSAHPNLYQFYEAFQSAGDCEEILYLSITSKMSGCYETAGIVCRDLMSRDHHPAIFVYDSLEVSFGLAILSMHAALAARAGKPASEIISMLDVIQPNIGVYFVMPTLKYAQMGGRVGAIKCFTVDSIGIKPLLCFSGGLVRDVGFSRGIKAAERAVFDRYQKEADFEKDVFVFHSSNLESAEELRAKINTTAPRAKVRIEWVGAAIGLYTGEGVLGVAFEKRQ